MRRKEFFKCSSLAVGAAAVNPLGMVQNNNEINKLRPSKKVGTKSPLAITMWDFSWLGRRWPGAGFEDWDEALNGLLVRGYNAVRIDVDPHLVVKILKKNWSCFGMVCAGLGRHRRVAGHRTPGLL